MRTNQLRLLAHSVRYTHPARLLHRLRLEIKRRLLEANPSFRPIPPGQLPVRTMLPSCVFRPRKHAAFHGPEGAEARFLNLTWPLSIPMEWRPKALQLEVMNLHYMEYLEALPDQAVRGLVEDWIQQNPPYAAGYWRDHWNSYALSIRCVVWMQQAAARGFDLNDAWGRNFTVSLGEQLTFLAHHLELDIKGNHLIKNIKALLWGSAFFEGERSLSWFQLASRLLTTELDEQILPDGVHFERSPAYHAQVFADLLECLSVLPPGDLKESLNARLRQMAQALADLTHPDGLPSLFNDGGLHMAYSPEECLEAYVGLANTPVAPRSNFAFPAGGYFGLRTPESFLIADCGPIAPDSLPAHGHSDMLAFEWSLRGQRIVVDTGVYEYVEGPARARSRSTAAHNTVSLDDADQCEFWGSFRVGRRGRAKLEHFEASDQEMSLLGSQNGYQRLPGRPLHRRRISSNGQVIDVTDQVEGGRGQRAAARLLLHPAVSAEPAPEGLLLRAPNSEIRLQTPHPVAVIRAPWYPDFGVCLETDQIVLEYGTAPCVGQFRLSVVG